MALSSIGGEVLSFIFLIFFLYLSFLISGAEVALFSLDSTDLKYLEENVKNNKIIHLLKHPKELLASLVISNTFINLLIILFVNIQLAELFNLISHNETVKEISKIGFEIFIIILFAEVLPKVYASKNNIKFALFSQTLTFIIFKLFYKVSLRLNKFSTRLENKFSNPNNRNTNNTISLDELKHAIELTSDREEKKEELLMLKSITDFKHKTIQQIMTPRLDMKSFSNKLSFANVKNKINTLQFSRIPVYQKNVDNIIGILHTKDLLPFLKEKTNFIWTQYVKETLFIIENQTLEICLKQMQEKKVQLAVVINEFGLTQGIVSFEDIVEEIVGEIVDEFDSKEKKIKLTNNNTLVLEAKMGLQEFIHLYKIPPINLKKLGNASGSLAGLLLNLFEGIPPIGKSIIWNNLKFTIIKTDKKRIIKVKVKTLK